MAAMLEDCTVCNQRFEVQFRYQMEEREGGFAFFCSQVCHGKEMRGENAGGVTCSACMKRFTVELVSQVIVVKGDRRYACGDACRTQVLAEVGGARLGAFTAPMPVVTPTPAPITHVTPITQVVPAAQPSPPRAHVAPDTHATQATQSAYVTQVTRVAPPSVPSAVTSPATAVTSASAPPAVAPRASRKLHGPKKLAIFNHKGGTGKTTTSVSVAAGLAARGLRVLLVDTDSQGNIGVSLNVKASTTLYHVLVMGMKATDAAVNVRPNLDVLVSNETLAAAELYLAGRQNRDRILKERLASAADAYDVVVLDCSPSLSLMNQNALVFADGILVPVACDFLSLVGVRQVIKTVKNVNSLLHHPVQIYGVLPTFYDARARICRDAVETMKEHFGERCLAPIRATIKVKEAPAQGKTIFEYAPESNAAEDYKRVVDRLVDGAAAVKSRAPVQDDGDRMSDLDVCAASA